VLELGAASGHVTRVLVERHCDVTAVEYEAEVAEELEGVASEVIVGDLDDDGVLDRLPGGFDVVLAGDVLEHLVDPARVLRHVAGLLVPGGRVVISVPNVAHADLRMALLQGTWDYRPWGLLDRTHLRFFTKRSIEALVEQAGLVTTELRRVRIPAFESELAVPRDSVPTAVVDHVLADPEAETYQYVLAAIKEGQDDHVRRLAQDKQLLEMRVDWAEAGRAAAEADAAEQRRHVAQREQEYAAVVVEFERRLAEQAARLEQQAPAVAERDAAVAELDVAIAQRDWAIRDFEAARDGLRRVEESVTWQSLQRLRRAAGDERSPLVRGAQAGLRGFGRVALRGRRAEP
jgi:SAM-dependent methyltransferase